MRGVSRNVSQSGVQVEVPNLPEKDTIHLMFRIPRFDSIVDAVGTVIWSSEKRHGIKFSKVNTRGQRSIKQFVKEQTRI
jgi:hypothetical protein